MIAGSSTASRRTCSAFEGDSHVEWFEGNYEDYEKDHKRRAGADADQPHRIKYRKIDA